MITGKEMNKCARDMHFYTYKSSDFLWDIRQTVLTEIRRRKMWRLIRIYNVCSQTALLYLIKYKYGVIQQPSKQNCNAPILNKSRKSQQVKGVNINN